MAGGEDHQHSATRPFQTILGGVDTVLYKCGLSPPSPGPQHGIVENPHPGVGED